MRPVLVVSPHLDDAVLSAGQFLADRPDATVVTLFAGIPAKGTSTDYDRQCGFPDSRDMVIERRVEDVNAMAVLTATPVHLDFFDHQYDIVNDHGAMVDALAAIIEYVAPEYVLAPLGLVHPDHVTARNVALAAASVPVVLYEELPYRVIHPEVAVARVVDMEPASIGVGPLHRKLTAMWCYRSQMHMPDLVNVHNMLVPERFWRATP